MDAGPIYHGIIKGTYTPFMLHGSFSLIGAGGRHPTCIIDGMQHSLFTDTPRK